MEQFLIGAASAVMGVYLIARRKQFAARTIRERNRHRRKKYGPRVVKQTERTAIVLGIFGFVLALQIWFDWGWP
jgi:hypothetical protein